MSVQLFLQGKILGIEEFVPGSDGGGESRMAARSLYVTLASEVLPRALLAELGLAKILLGASGGGQFLLILPGASRAGAEAFLDAAAGDLKRITASGLSLVWAFTENLGDWTIVRRRLNDELAAKRGTSLAASDATYFEPYEAESRAEASADPFPYAGLEALRMAASASWSPEQPAMVSAGAGKYSWSLTGQGEAIPVARHAAQTADGLHPASAAVLASRARGKAAWGVLRGDVDTFGLRLRRAQTVEEHVQLSVVYKQFFAGELEVACSMPDYWRKVSILYAGGDDFAVYGAWDALILLARELQRLFHLLTDAALKEFPGHEGKSISMALAVAGEGDSPASVYAEAGRRLEIAKSAGKDCFYLLGKTLEWKQMGEASGLKDRMARIVIEHGCSPEFLNELASFYQETPETAVYGAGRRRERRFERPWRFHRRLNRVLTGPRDREFQKDRTALLGDLIGRGGAQRKLRPSGRVALEWAMLWIGM